MHFHWQNLNERRSDSGRVKGSAWRHGRAWWHFKDRVASFEWSLLDFRCTLGFSFQPDERKVVGYFVIPLIGIYCGLTGIGGNWFWNLTKRKGEKYGTPRQVLFRIFDWALWLDLWSDEMSSSSRDPWWWKWHLDIPDFFLGRNKYQKVTHGDPKRVWIPLPEGEYLAEAKFSTSTWTRPRWPWWPLKKVWPHTEISVQHWHGLPHQGKGENSWDCGQDGLFGYSSDGHDLAAAIAKGVESTLKSRKKYDGSIRAGYPDPHITKVEGVKAFADLAARIQKMRVVYPLWGPVDISVDLQEDKAIVRVIERSLPKKTDGPDGPHVHVRAMTTTKALAKRWPKLLEESMQTVVVEEDNAASAAC